MKTDTICDLVLLVGENCEGFLRRTVRNVEAKQIEMDEIWDFIAMKDRTKKKLGRIGDDVGDSWTWLAIDVDSKMILSHAVGLRDESTCERFLSQLNDATTGKCQVTSDGLGLYTYRVPAALGARISYAQLVKTYGNAVQTEARYSPAQIIACEKIPRFGQPNEDEISTESIRAAQSVGADARSPLHAVDECSQQDVSTPCRHDRALRCVV